MAVAGCKFPGCQRPHVAHGWCMTHYQRVRRTGSADDPRPKADVERIVEMVGLGLSYPEIAGALRVHPNTVKQIVDEIRKRAGVESKDELARMVNER